MRKRNSFLIFVLCVFFLVNGCVKKQEAAKAKEVIPVKVMKVQLGNIQKALDYVGDIKAQDEAIIYPKVNGKIIEKVIEEGTSVNKGDILAYIDRDEVGFKFEKAPVESSLTGIVGRVYVDIGTSVTPQTPVALVVDMDNVVVDLDVPEEYLARVALGQSAEIRLQVYPDEKFIGKVSEISPVLDLDTRTAPVEITIPNSGHRLKSGMFVKVNLVIAEHKNVPVILKEAIMGKNTHQYVFVIQGNKALLKKVVLGIRQGPFYEVKEGLKEGEMVVIMGQQRLYDGAEAAPEE